MLNHPFYLFFKLSRPLFIGAGFFFYALGAGIARYLGYPLDSSVYWLGQLGVSALQLSTHYLNEFFDQHSDANNPNRNPFSGGSGVLGEGEGKLPEQVALLAAASALTVFALSLLGLWRADVLYPLALLVAGLASFGAIFYSVPPLRLVSSGFGELVASVTLANLVPAFAFVLQSGEWHRFLAMSTFPLTALAMATLMSFEFSDYANDLKHAKQTFLVRVGWQQGIRFHALFVLAAYALIALAGSLGMPVSIAYPPFLSFPVALLQIWLFRRIEEGKKPNWTALLLTSAVNTMLVLYLYLFAFWTR